MSFFYSKRTPTRLKPEVLHEKLKTVLNFVIFNFSFSRTPISPNNFKTHKTYVLQRFLLYTYISTPKLYILGIDVYVCKRNRCTTKVLLVQKFLDVGVWDFFFKIKTGRTVFNFSNKTSCFVQVFFFFWVKKDNFLLRINIVNFKTPKLAILEFLMKKLGSFLFWDRVF